MNCKWLPGAAATIDFISIHLCRGSLQRIKRRFCPQSNSASHRYIFISALLNERKYCCRDTLAPTLLWRGCTVFLRATEHKQTPVSVCCSSLWPKSDSAPAFHLPGRAAPGSCWCPDRSKQRESIVLMRSLTHAVFSDGVQQQVLSSCVCRIIENL